MLGRSEYDSKLSNLFIKYANTSLLADNKWLNDITSIEKNRLLVKMSMVKNYQLHLILIMII